MIIDAHTHVYPDEFVRDQELISKIEPYFDLLTHNRVHKWGNAEDLIRRMDETNVDQAWIFGFAFRDAGLCRSYNDYIIDILEKYPNRFKGFASISPNSKGFTSEIERCADFGLVGVGELFPDGQGFNIDDIRQTWRLATVLEERNLILNIHTAEPVGHDYSGKGNVGPKEAAKLCVNHPDIKIVFAHFGGGLWLYESMPEMKLYLRNAYYDTAAWPFLYDGNVLKSAKALGVLKKILYGSDWPILDKRNFESRINSSQLTNDEMNDFMSGNAINILSKKSLI